MSEQDYYEAQNENEALDEALTEVKSLIENLEDAKGWGEWVHDLNELKKQIESIMNQNEHIMDAYWEENTKSLNLEWEASR